jgi:hypothetical protein
MIEETNIGEQEIQMQEGRQDLWRYPSGISNLTWKYSKK